LGGSASPQYRTFLKFTVSDRAGSVQRAVLRLYVIDGSTDGGAVYAVSPNYRYSNVPWTETGLTRANEPLVTGSPVAYIGSVSATTFVDLDVTSAVPGNGTYSFAIVQSGSDATVYRSRQGSLPEERPRLIVVTAPVSPRSIRAPTVR
jgi:acid phosphatase type 7